MQEIYLIIRKGKVLNMLRKYVVIDKMEGEVYYYPDEITMGFAMEGITDRRDRLDIEYHIKYYNFGRVIVIY